MTIFWKALAIFAILAAVAFGGYTKGKEEVQKLWNADRLVATEALAKATEETRGKEAELRMSKEKRDELVAQRDEAVGSVAGLSRRLRLASRSSGCSLPEDAAAAGGDSPGAVPDGVGEIERDSDAAWAAAALDSTGLTQCRARYEEVRAIINRESPQ